MLNSVNLATGDMGRGMRVSISDLPLVFRIISEFIPHLNRRAINFAWSYGVEILKGAEKDMDKRIKMFADQFKLELYEVNGKVLFDVTGTHQQIFYILKRNEISLMTTQEVNDDSK